MCCPEAPLVQRRVRIGRTPIRNARRRVILVRPQLVVLTVTSDRPECYGVPFDRPTCRAVPASRLSVWLGRRLIERPSVVAVWKQSTKRVGSPARACARVPWRTADMPVIHLVFRCTPLECDDPPRVPVARLCRSPRFNGGASALACRRRPGRRSTTGRRCAPPTRRSKGHWRGCDRAAGDQPGDMPSAARPRQ